jgi:hypothetical protein
LGLFLFFWGDFCIIWENFVLFGGIIELFEILFVFFGGGKRWGHFCIFCFFFVFFGGIFIFFGGKISGGIFVFFGGIFYLVGSFLILSLKN